MKGIITSRRQTGFTLIEILVTIVILSIGLLGIAGMQASGLRNNHAAYTKTQATNLAMDMADRIRANPRAARGDTYLYDSANGMAEDPGCIAAGCTPAQVAQYDKYQWSIPILGKNDPADDSVKPALPDGRGIISRDGDQFVITLLWREPAYEEMARAQCIENQGEEMACFQMRVLP